MNTNVTHWMRRGSMALALAFAVSGVMAQGSTKLTGEEVQAKLQKLKVEIKRIRDTESGGIGSAIGAFGQSGCVKGKLQGGGLGQPPKSTATTGGSGQTPTPKVGGITLDFGKIQQGIIGARALGDKELPHELGNQFVNWVSTRPAPPIPGKEGNLTGESKINEHYQRETRDTKNIMQPLSMLSACPEFNPLSAAIEKAQKDASNALQNLMKTALQKPKAF